MKRLSLLILFAILAAFVIIIPGQAEGQQPQHGVYSHASIRAAFVYAWYPEQWTGAGHRYTSTLGEYESGDPSVISAHINQLQYAKIDAGIYSWWGRNSATDQRFPAYLDVAESKNFKWAVYYEMDFTGTRSPGDIWWDLMYLKDTYFNRASYLHVDGKPVLFIYSPGGTCDTVAKWKALGTGLYLSMTDVANWWTCNVLDSWHPYRPASRVAATYAGSTLYAMSVSAGFWAAWEDTPRLSRDFTAWEQSVGAVQQWNPPWQLYYFNEFGEGTNIEPSTARCEAYMCSDYLGTLNRN